MNFSYIFIIVVSLFVFSPSFVWADEESSSSLQRVTEPSEKMAGPNKGHVYFPITRATLAQLYWKMESYDLSNDTDVDNFLLINRCDLYREYYRDDFAWHRIRMQAKESLEKNAGKFPDRFKLVQPIGMGRYNVEKELLMLARPIRTSRFEIVAEEEWPCNDLTKGGRVWKYPHIGIVTFATAVDIDSIYVKPEVARAYNRVYSHIDIHSYRPAYIVINFKVLGAQPVKEKQLRANQPAEIQAIIESIDFFADLELTMHLGTLDYRLGNKKRFLQN